MPPAPSSSSPAAVNAAPDCVTLPLVLNVRLLAPVFNAPLIAMLPLALRRVSASVKVCALTVTRPLPVPEPMVMELKPSCRKPSFVASRLSVPAPPATPTVLLSVSGPMLSAPVPLTLPPSTSTSVAMVSA